MNKKKKRPSLLKFTLLSLGSMVAYNTVEYKKATSKVTISKREAQYFEGRFGKIAYKVLGEGDPLLLIHNLGAADNYNEWNKVIKRFQDTHKIYAIDLPGCGLSDKTFFEYSAYMYALAINEFVNNVIINGNDVKVTAISSGCSYSLLATAASISNCLYKELYFINPKNVELTFCDPFTNKNIVKAIRYIISLPVIGSFIYNLIYSKENILKRLNCKEYRNLTDSEKEALADAMYEAAHTNGFSSKYVHNSIHSNLLYADISRILPKVHCPCNVIAGEGMKPVDKTVTELCKLDNIHVIRLSDVASVHLEAASKLYEIINN